MALRFPSLSPLFSSLLLPFSSLPSLLSSPSSPSLCSPFSSLPPLLVFSFFSFLFFSSAALPCIYRKTGGANGGAATVGRPCTICSMDKKEASGRRMVGVLLRQIRERSSAKSGEEKFFSPVLCVRREEDDGAVSKRHRFAFFL